jgi:hypothetical protein
MNHPLFELLSTSVRKTAFVTISVCLIELALLLTGAVLQELPKAAFAQTSAEKATKAASDEEIVYRATFGRADDIDILLKKGADVNAKNDQGWSILAIASDRVDPEAPKIVASLLKGGANPNVFDPVSKSYPILNAVKNDSAAIVKLLIDAGADYKVKDASGKSLIDYANARGKKEVIAPIQAKLDGEAAAAAALRSPERFKKLIYDYGFYSCGFQYYTFYQDSGQNPERKAEITNITEQIKKNLQYASNEMRTYYPFVKKEFYDGVSGPAIKKIYDELNAMVSNGVRRSKGIGKSGDMEKRCANVMKKISIKIPDKLQ